MRRLLLIASLSLGACATDRTQRCLDPGAVFIPSDFCESQQKIPIVYGAPPEKVSVLTLEYPYYEDVLPEGTTREIDLPVWK